MHPADESHLISLIDNFPSHAVLFKCGVCGIPWEEHNAICCEHSRKWFYISLREFALTKDKYKKIFTLAITNGWKNVSPIPKEQPANGWTRSFNISENMNGVIGYSRNKQYLLLLRLDGER